MVEKEQDFSKIITSFIETTYGKIRYKSVGNPSHPLFLIVHGSGVNNGADIYDYILHEYSIRYYSTWKIYIVSFDCPGYGKSTGLRSAIRAFPGKLISELCFLLTGKKNCFILMGHSQGGFSAFNACLEINNLCSLLIGERPVCGDLKRLKNFKIPTLLIYDEEDDGHPINQGKQMTKLLIKYRFIAYKNSKSQYFVSDYLLFEILRMIKDNQNLIISNNPHVEEFIPDYSIVEMVNGLEFSKKNKECTIFLESKIKDSTIMVKKVNNVAQSSFNKITNQEMEKNNLNSSEIVTKKVETREFKNLEMLSRETNIYKERQYKKSNDRENSIKKEGKINNSKDIISNSNSHNTSIQSENSSNLILLSKNKLRASSIENSIHTNIKDSNLYKDEEVIIRNQTFHANNIRSFSLNERKVNLSKNKKNLTNLQNIKEEKEDEETLIKNHSNKKSKEKDDKKRNIQNIQTVKININNKNENENDNLDKKDEKFSNPKPKNENNLIKKTELINIEDDNKCP